MPYRDPGYVQKKIELIEKGLPIDITEAELQELEETLRGARSFYIDIVQALMARQEKGEDIETFVNDENKNLAGVEIALRKIDDFRKNHWSHIKNQE
jgi:hypothetical protein